MSGVHDAGYRPSAWGTTGDHESRIRKLEATPGNLTVTDGGTIVDPTTEIDIGAGLTLTDLGSGVAGLAAGAGSVIGWLAADVARGANALFDSTLGTYPYHADWDNAVTDEAGAPCGTLTSASGLTLPAGNFLIYFSAWTVGFSIRPHPTFSFVSHNEFRVVVSTASDPATAGYVGTMGLFAVLSGSKVITCGVDTLGGGDPTSDALVTMFITRFS